MDNLKTYRNKSGYIIKATEKAYNLFYKKQGFIPVENPVSNTSDELTKEDSKRTAGRNRRNRQKAVDETATDPEVVDASTSLDPGAVAEPEPTADPEAVADIEPTADPEVAGKSENQTDPETVADPVGHSKEE